MADFVYTQPFIVIGVFIVRDGKVLLIQENHYPDQGKWNIPAGKLNFGEDPLQTAKREAFEESGLDFTPTAVLGIHSIHRKDIDDGAGQVHALRIIFVGDAAGEVSLEHGETEDGIKEISGYQWLSPEEVLALDDTTLRYHDIKQLVEKYQSGVTYPLNLIAHIVQRPK